MKSRSWFGLLSLLVLAGILSACGGGGGSSSDDDDNGDEVVVVVLPPFVTGTGFDDHALAVIARADGSGQIYVGGRFTSYNGTPSNRIIRLNQDGTVDTSFNVGTGFSNRVWALELAADGSGDIYVGGEFGTYNGMQANRIARLNSDGSLDAGFDALGGFNGIVYTIVAQTDGSVYVGGDFQTYRGASQNNIARLDSNAAPNASFALGAGFNGTVTEIVLANDGSGDIYVTGAFTTYQGAGNEYITRLNSNASVDGGFSNGSSLDNSGIGLAIADDGSGDFVVGGIFNTYRFNPRNRIVRIDSAGPNVTSFAPGDGFDLSVFVVTPTGDGNGEFYAGGIFSNFDNVTAEGIARIDSTGALAPGFPAGTGFIGAVQDILAINDASGSLYVVGEFTQYNGADAGRIIRLDAAGQPN